MKKSNATTPWDCRPKSDSGGKGELGHLNDEAINLWVTDKLLRSCSLHTISIEVC